MLRQPRRPERLPGGEMGGGQWGADLSPFNHRTRENTHMRHVHSCGRRLHVVWVAAALLFALSAGPALASSTPSAPPAGTVTTADPRDDYAGSAAGSGASSTECFDSLSTSAC